MFLCSLCECHQTTVFHSETMVQLSQGVWQRPGPDTWLEWPGGEVGMAWSRKYVQILSPNNFFFLKMYYKCQVWMNKHFCSYGFQHVPETCTIFVHASCPCCISPHAHVNTACPCCIFMLYVRVACQSAACHVLSYQSCPVSLVRTVLSW
jgi:hypothetical protein